MSVCARASYKSSCKCIISYYYSRIEAASKVTREGGGGRRGNGRKSVVFQIRNVLTLSKHGIRRIYFSFQSTLSPFLRIFDSGGAATTGFCYCKPTRCNLASARVCVCMRVCPRGCRLAVSWERRSACPWSRYTPLHCGSCLRSERVHLVSSTRLCDAIDTQVHDCEARLVPLLEISCDEKQRMYKRVKLFISFFV